MREWTSKDLALVEALDLIEPWGPERLDLAVAQLTQVVAAMFMDTPPDLETLTGKAGVIVSRRQAVREGARVASDPPDKPNPAASAMAKLVGSGIPFKVVTDGDDRQSGAGPESEG